MFENCGKEQQEKWSLWKQGGARQSGWQSRQVGDEKDLSRAEDELHAKT